MTLPNFLVIGAAKSGTTALHELLGAHPQIFMSAVKETNFFAFDGAVPEIDGPGVDFSGSVLDRAAYEALFAPVDGEIAVGEVSPMYMAEAETAAERIASLLSEVKLLAMVRHPAERAFSSFLHLRRDGREPLSDFGAALAAEPSRIDDGWGYLWRYRQLGRYADQLRPYYRRFPSSSIKVCVYDRFRDAPDALLAEVDRFLGVDPDLRRPLSVRPNVSGEPRSDRLARRLRSPGRVTRTLTSVLPRSTRRRMATAVGRLNLRRPEIPPELRRQLTEELAEQLHELAELTGIDLSDWLEDDG